MDEKERVRRRLAEAAVDRAGRYLTIDVPQLPDPEKLDEFTMLGSHSFCLVSTRRRLIKDKLLIMDDIYETPSALARDYLRLEYEQGSRATKRQYLNTAGMPPAPSYALPDRFAHGQYVDVQAAYWSIMQIVGWDVDYNPGLWLSPGKPPKSFPFPEHHVARDCLVSAGRMSGIPTYNPKRRPGNPYDTLKTGNKLKNNLLPRLILDLLNSLGAQCVAEGAIYVNNDGIIAPTPGIGERCAGIMADWGLSGRIKYEGSGEVKAGGTYIVGPHKTLNYQHQKNSLPVDHIYAPPYARWLQNEFSHFASKRR